jgi:HSP20 family protein
MLTRWDPFNEVLSLRDAMNRLFEESFVRPYGSNQDGANSSAYALPLDVYDNGDELVVNANLPGFKPEDVNITIHGDTLTIQAKTTENREDKGKNYLVREMRYGSFARSITLPTQVKADLANAQFENGVLHLTLPKAEQAKPRQIKVGNSNSHLIEGQAQSITTTNPTVTANQTSNK